MSVVGNISPVSTTTIRPSCSTVVMFLPISPSPPSGRTRSGAVNRRCPRLAPGARALAGRAPGDQEAMPLQRRPDCDPLLLTGGNHRQPHVALDDAQHLERGLDGDRIAGHRGRLIDRLKL